MEVPLAREDLQPNPRCEETKSVERVARSMAVCIKWRWIRSSARLTVQLRARAVFLLYGDIHIHGCVLPPPYGALWLCSVDYCAHCYVLLGASVLFIGSYGAPSVGVSSLSHWLFDKTCSHFAGI